MSHGKSRPKHTQQKRFQVTDTTGWTHIIKGSRSQSNQQHLLSTSLQPTEISEGLTLEKVLEKHETCTRRWRESDCLKEVERILHEEVLTSNKVIITRCVCLGLGSLTRAYGETANSWYELATLISVLEILGKGIHEFSHCGKAINQSKKGKGTKSRMSMSRIQCSITWTKPS